MSRRARAKRSDKLTGILLIVLGIILIAALVAGIIYVRTLHVDLDKETNCPIAGPTAVHVVIVDRSDPISPLQAQRVTQWAELAKASAEAGTRFDIYVFEGDTQNELLPLLTTCAPEQPRDANPLYQNPENIRKRYETKFADVFDKTIAGLLHATTRPSSPIIESLRAAAQTSFGPLVGKNIPLRITLISDLVQNSALVSHFRSAPDFEQLARSANWARLRPELRGADVEILYILRPTALRGISVIQNRGHQEFWTRLIAASGGRISEFTPF